ncbi:TetR/AcrR family transcriptional regulator [Rhodococcoides kyotonense]|uniref:DNA-binding transcriptional regulator, AcrR family n=1 Tax=Rhodococcoides kyotonense TaxID=398843 RepID=A0A239MXJ1_9NOCA|nr:TetR/AcrR family transcriptional regulator [Rhodococcus kyotonensis]SNT46854.1 DNA-binding transcriptional regulator, AcrR family [Rhodococcus kyotonensis]
MSTTEKRPAHRPSRRGVIVETAFELFATGPVDAVTVADIAAAAGMTSAAIYYHYPSREEILLEGLREFSSAYVGEIRRITTEESIPDGSLGSLVPSLARWLEDNRTRAVVYFVHARGSSQLVEALRRDNTADLIPILSGTARKVRGKLSAAEAGVIAVALIAQIEVFASSLLSKDSVFDTLGRKKYVETAARLSDRIAGTANV